MLMQVATNLAACGQCASKSSGRSIIARCLESENRERGVFALFWSCHELPLYTWMSEHESLFAARVSNGSASSATPACPIATGVVSM